MKGLIAAAAARLRASIADVKDRDVYVTEDTRLIRSYGDYPAVGLKDGGTGYIVESGDQTGELLTLRAACYVKLHKPEAAVMGDPATGSPGVLELAASVLTALDTTFSGMVDLAEPLEISESELLIDDSQAIQMIVATMRYTRWS